MPSTRSTRAKRNGTPVDLKSKQRKLTSEDDTQIKQSVVIDNASLADISDKLLSLEHTLCQQLRNITFGLPVEYVYSPVEYAYDVHAMYIRRYCNDKKRLLFLGMNPGPWGMSQTGVPFGEISMVRDWLNISGFVGKPAKEHPDRKITGFECMRSEVSGKRFWGLFQNLCGNPEKFFQHAFVHNYCPLALMDKKGRNITPADIKGAVQHTLHLACDEALRDTIRLLDIQIVIGIGKYAEKRAQIAVQAANLPVQVLYMPHPSPRAVHNENWTEKATKKLNELGLLGCFTD